ncbi:hypothetical protein L6452_17955 [Arctium lappa]|uniref:Uncharacterized protein n=1 Tax=Arctium lappa TaxID=4217 RepID=A0ACB9C4P9_ARCLA|nr:hypothetical protein L6452_17955 [Arctium lappa]
MVVVEKGGDWGRCLVVAGLICGGATEWTAAWGAAWGATWADGPTACAEGPMVQCAAPAVTDVEVWWMVAIDCWCNCGGDGGCLVSDEKMEGGEGERVLFLIFVNCSFGCDGDGVLRRLMVGIEGKKLLIVP